jgi:hypothetical protein
MTSRTKAIAKMSKPLIKSLQSRQGALPGAVSHFVSNAAAPVQPAVLKLWLYNWGIVWRPPDEFDPNGRLVLQGG